MSTSMRKWLKSALPSLPFAARVIDRHARTGFPIFMLHRVLPEREACYDPEMVTPIEMFDGFLGWLSERYEVVSIPELVRERAEPPNRVKALCALTFDDGWRDTYLHAFPLLQRYRMTATVFLAVRFIGTGRAFWQERLSACLDRAGKRGVQDALLRFLSQCFPWCPRLTRQEFTFCRLRQLLLTRPSQEAEEFARKLEEATGTGEGGAERVFLNWEEVRVMRDAGIAFGSHTLNHTLLTRASPETARQEIEISRRELEHYLSDRVWAFSYPWGHTTPQITQQVKEAGYAFALTTERALVGQSTVPWLLPRVPISGPTLGSWNGKFEPARTTLYLATSALRARMRNHTSRWRQASPGRLRLALVIDTIDDWNGGTERQLSHLLQILDKRYFEPEIFLLQPSAALRPMDFPCPVHLASQDRTSRRFGILRELFLALRQFRPHIVQTFFEGGSLYGTLASRMAHAPVLVRTKRNTIPVGSAYHRLALRVLNRLVDSWQCNSRAVAALLENAERIPRTRIEILPNSVDLACFSPANPQEQLAARCRLGIPPTAPVFVIISNLRPIKDLPTLVEAAAQLHRCLPKAQFLLIGDGPERSSLAAQVERLHLKEVVRLVGPQPDVRPWLIAADIGLLTSCSEGSSNALLEYMAMGLPAVASDIPANCELVEGVFFSPGNPRDLAEKALDLWNRPDLRVQMRRDYCCRAAKYSLDAFTERVQSYYVWLTAGHFQR